MKKIDKLKSTLKGFTSTINRYPITILLFLLSAILASYQISTNDLSNISELLFALAFGAALFMVLQIVYERFCHVKKIRIIFAGLAILGTVVYYLIVELLIKNFSTEHAIKTMVLLFVLLIGFMWIPVIKSRIGFSDSFMVVFKTFFTVALYSGVLYLGVSLIITAINMLIVDVDSDAYVHVGNIIAYIYAPIHFLSLIPIYPKSSDDIGLETEGGSDNHAEDDLTQKLNKAIEPSKFLGGLVSYIIIPITAIFTVILLLYIIMNIAGDFWKDNLMEPLLVTYSITVIIVYLLATEMPGKAAFYFRRIFPKVLIPVVLFQTISSVLKIGELGITSGRYYVIMFGIFATICAVIFSIRPNHKNNIIAPILIVLSLISIAPPVDAFTISKSNQINRLTNVLEKYDMLKDNKIVPNTNIADEDRQTIINSVRYLSRMDYLKDISWLRAYSNSYDFERTFGFNQYGPDTKSPDGDAWRLYLAERTPIDISEYDIFVEVDLYGESQGESSFYVSSGINGYSIEQDNIGGIGDLVIRDEQDKELIRYSLSEIFDSFKDRDVWFGEMTRDEAEFIIENNDAILYILVKSLNFEVWENSDYQNIQAYIMVKVK
ncbi:MAG: DUF4153 domain-containing protein [Herbinix sp.]|nr:DUF4153 domain-containing protein [Herbinix sp.]